MPFARLSVVLCAFLLVLSGCGSIERVTDEEEDEAELSEAEALAQVETFDVDQYGLEAPERVVDIEHRVPAQLMEVRAGAGVERTVDGFRVQIHSTDDRRAADDMYTRAEEWWDEKREGEELRAIFDSAVPDEPPVYLVYRQPLYRVRVGDFRSQEQARELMQLLREEFGDAFVARSRVTVRQ